MVVRKALEARHPRSHYLVGGDARMAVVGSLLPDRLIDLIISKILSGKLSSKALGW